MKPRICVSLPVEKISNIVPMIRRAEGLGTDLIEIRLDYMNADALKATDKLREVVAESSVPLIATNRHYEQGGYHPQDEERRIQTLIEAATFGFRYVDVELTTEKLESTVQKVISHGARPIVSLHDFKGTPRVSEMEKIVNSQIKSGAEICKLITTANDVVDSVKCLLFTRKMSENVKVVCFAMGGKGLLSRAFSPFFGAFFTFASLESSLETASGQMSIADLKELYRKLGVCE
ncbi:MAG: type I 3-dehydroquinate dehydratase [Candidatus Bathyarchaeota archaeon]|nr:type I 3-dehydroquinate dehydratase [Candidatus Bathyarchaeota archaeon]